MNFELVAGLETHVELSTNTKIFCSCTTAFGGEPNTHCCEVCTGMPGTLPTLNRRVVEYAIRAGLATNCRINKHFTMARKNYSYPDLPKAYQISQSDTPLCEGGYIELSNGKKIRINRIHIEEDAGKLVHEGDNIYVDYNRAGVPLIEIVSEPDLRSALEAHEYVEKLQILMRFIGISDCRMQEGSMRCDVNVSVRREGDTTLGTRTEVKNMNSLANMVKAMEYEYDRQCKVLRDGGKVTQDTLRFDDKQGITSPMRSKEDAKDYRFFTEPDIKPVELSDEFIEAIRASLPELPDVRRKRYVNEFGLSPEDAFQLTKYRSAAEYFEEVASNLQDPRVAARFIIGQIFAGFNTEADKEKFATPVSAKELSKLLSLLEQGKISKNIAKLTLDKMLTGGGCVRDFITDDDIRGVSDDELDILCRQAIEHSPKAVTDYLGGKEKALMSLLGFVMRESRGRADATLTKEKLIALLNNN